MVSFPCPKHDSKYLEVIMRILDELSYLLYPSFPNVLLSLLEIDAEVKDTSFLNASFYSE